jgi:prepilin-type N-terminal cleavage/methylation domain-containing protein
MHQAQLERRALTLVELLVVIAIIALLMAILLPSLRKVRVEGWKTVSLANLHSITQAGGTYQAEQRGLLPIIPSKPVDSSSHYKLWRPWTAFGKNCDYSWTARFNAYFDMPAAWRPLNPYLMSERIEGPLPGQQVFADGPIRRALRMPVCDDPSNRLGHQQQRQGHGMTEVLDNNAPALNCYEDVGASYMWQELWARHLQVLAGDVFVDVKPLFNLGNLRFRDETATARLVWVNDEWANLVMALEDEAGQVRNGYGDINKGVLGFMDGHVAYLPIVPMGHTNLSEWQHPMNVRALNNEHYQAVFTRSSMARAREFASESVAGHRDR